MLTRGTVKARALRNLHWVTPTYTEYHAAYWRIPALMYSHILWVRPRAKPSYTPVHANSPITVLPPLRVESGSLMITCEVPVISSTSHPREGCPVGIRDSDQAAVSTITRGGQAVRKLNTAGAFTHWAQHTPGLEQRPAPHERQRCRPAVCLSRKSQITGVPSLSIRSIYLHF
ncbi:unnamed protein product [Pleuronectes platessa]|uniref:Uncharacterized protein n=1 Tax=Pleuronectes platessa TaxID=8262 RepID=A0A9N7UHL3_PLEPL|nr:unnamed protein product [Pleuronectes platessa]